MQTAWANWRLRPSLPASVQSRSRAGPRNRSIAASFSSRDSPPWNTATSCPASASRCRSSSWVARNCVKMTILSRELGEQLEQPVDLGALVLGGGPVGQVVEPRRGPPPPAWGARPSSGACRPPPGWSCPAPSAASPGPSGVRLAASLVLSGRAEVPPHELGHVVGRGPAPAATGATRSVCAQRRVNCRPTVLRRLRTITSASRRVQLVDVARRQLVAAVDEVALELPWPCSAAPAPAA